MWELASPHLGVFAQLAPKIERYWQELRKGIEYEGIPAELLHKL